MKNYFNGKMPVILKMCILIGLLFMYLFIIGSHFNKTTIKRHAEFSEGITSSIIQDEDEDEDEDI